MRAILIISLLCADSHGGSLEVGRGKSRAINFQMVTDINDRHPNLMPVDYSFGEVTHMIVIFPF